MNRQAWNVKLINKNHGKWLTLTELPEEALRAVIIYSFGGVEQWADLCPQDIVDALETLKERFGKKRFGLAEIPMADAKKYLIGFMPKEEIGRDWSTFDEYHQWYITAGGGGLGFDKRLVKHLKQWPVILSGYDDEFIQDGWHRFHSYVMQNRKTIPVLLYPRTT